MRSTEAESAAAVARLAPRVPFVVSNAELLREWEQASLRGADELAVVRTSATSAPGPPSRSASHAAACSSSRLTRERGCRRSRTVGCEISRRLPNQSRTPEASSRCALPAGTWGTKGAAQAFFRICTGTGVTLPESSVGNSRLGIRASPGQPDLRTHQWLVVGARCSLARKCGYRVRLRSPCSMVSRSN